MSFLDRLRGNIQLTSPNGDIFTPKWIGNDRSKEKKLGVFEYPNVNGTKVQDLGINGTRYPLTLHFDGEDNDLESTRFYTACDQTGTWQVIHPTKGELTLQLQSVSESIQPVESGSITVFSTSWIEVIVDGSTVSGQQIGATVDAESASTNIACIDQYADNITIDSASEILANTSSIGDIVDIISGAFTDIVSTVTTVNTEFQSTIRGIQDTLSQPVIALDTLASQVQTLIQLPTLAVDSIEDILDIFSTASDSVLSLLLIGKTPEAKNSATAFELGLTGIVTGGCLSVISGELTTRTQVVEIAELLTELLGKVTYALDDVQSNFDNNSIDKQYFSQSGAYNNLKVLVGTTLNYLIESSLSLKVEKRFSLEKPRSPIEITVSEYGSLGVDDSNYHFFQETNKLTGGDILILPAGREVVVYV